MAAAKRRGIPVLELSASPPLLQLGTGAYQRRLAGSVPAQTGTARHQHRREPALTRRLLHGAGMPVSAGIVVRDVDGAVQAARRLGYPSSWSPTVTAGTVAHGAPWTAMRRFGRPSRVSHERRSPAGWSSSAPPPARSTASWWWASRWWRWPNGGRPLAPGTGRRTGPTASLNATIRRRPRSWPCRISRREDIADDGSVVPQPATGHRDRGGIAIDRTDEIHPDNVAIARQAAKVVGLEVAGIDLITPDIARSMLTGGGRIVAVDPAPDLRLHTHPTEGTPRDVGMAIVDHLFPPGQPVRVPIVAVTGTNGKTTTTRLIAHIMTTAGKRVGMTTSDGIDIAGTAARHRGSGGGRRRPQGVAPPGHRLRRVGDAARPYPAAMGWASTAATWPWSPMWPAITSARWVSRHWRIWPGSRRWCHGPSCRDGASVLNADDPLTAAMAEVAGGEILFFSMCEDNPVVRPARAAGGPGGGAAAEPRPGRC